MYKAISMGEALIDFIPNKKGCSLTEVEGFTRVAGGAPANVSAAICKLGGESYVITQLGKDAFGDYIINVLKEAGVNTSYISRTSKANTGLAFVSLLEDGNRDFSFYRNPSADMLLEESSVEEHWFKDCRIFHFCSVDLIEAPVKYAHKKALEYCEKYKTIVSFDPNVRLPLWSSPEECRNAILEFMPYAHILKISDEELTFITGIEDERQALKSLFKGNVKVVIYTKGADGAEFITCDKTIYCPGINVEVVDTTGAGDSFIGSFLFQLCKMEVSIEQLNKLDNNVISEMMSFSNRYAAFTTTKKGAIGAMPTLIEFENYSL